MWTTALASGCVLGGRCDSTSRAVGIITANLLRAFALGPAGLRHPSVPNLARYGITLLDPVDP